MNFYIPFSSQGIAFSHIYSTTDEVTALIVGVGILQ